MSKTNKEKATSHITLTNLGPGKKFLASCHIPQGYIESPLTPICLKSGGLIDNFALFLSCFYENYLDSTIPCEDVAKRFNTTPEDVASVRFYWRHFIGLH